MNCHDMIDRYAELISSYSVNVRKNDRILIKSTYLSEDLVNCLVKHILKRGGRPETRISLSGTEKLFYDYADEDALSYSFESEKLIYQTFEGIITIKAPFNLAELKNSSAEKKRIRQASTRDVQDIFSRRSGDGSLKWCICQYPVNSQAQESGMSLEEYRDFVYCACFLDRDNPEAAWRELGRRQERLKEFLNGVSTVRIKSGDTDISYSVKGRKWINSDGRRNMPSGEVFTSPVEDSVNGQVCFDFPVIYLGERIEGIRLVLRDGRVVDSEASRGEKLLREILSIPGADCFGEAAFGNNYGISRFTNNILFDEKIGGTIHFAIGNSYQETGGKNSSAVHIDLIADMRKSSEIFADDRLVYRDGAFIDSQIS